MHFETVNTIQISSSTDSEVKLNQTVDIVNQTNEKTHLNKFPKLTKQCVWKLLPAFDHLRHIQIHTINMPTSSLRADIPHHFHCRQSRLQAAAHVAFHFYSESDLFPSPPPPGHPGPSVAGMRRRTPPRARRAAARTPYYSPSCYRPAGHQTNPASSSTGETLLQWEKLHNFPWQDCRYTHLKGRIRNQNKF